MSFSCFPRGGSPCIDDVCRSMGTCAWSPDKKYKVVRTEDRTGYIVVLRRSGEKVAPEGNKFFGNQRRAKEAMFLLESEHGMYEVRS